MRVALAGLAAGAFGVAASVLCYWTIMRFAIPQKGRSMSVVNFKYYLHDNSSSSERAEWIESQTGVEMTDELIDKIGRPFYEVRLDCTLDTETGEVKVTGVSL